MLENALKADDDAPRRTLLPRVNRRSINLRRFRKSRCMSAPQFSAKTGIGVSSILDMEGGRHAITVKTMDRIADAFELQSWQVLAELDGAVLR